MASPQVPGEVFMNIYEFEHCAIRRRSDVNYFKIPTNIFKFNDEGMNVFNSIIDYFETQYEEMFTINRTKAGGISVKKGNLQMPAWDIRETKTRIELTIVTMDYCAKFQLSCNANNVDALNGRKIGGRQAFLTFKKICERFGVDLAKHVVDNGKEIKETLDNPTYKPMAGVCIEAKKGKTYFNVHHLDLNSSYMSGIAMDYPDLAPIIQHIYNNRKRPGKDLIYKAILTHTYGYFQSQYCTLGGHGYALANLSKSALEFNNGYIKDLCHELEESGRTVLFINTDGIWYQGDLFEDPNCGFGNGLGHWKTDYKDCKFRVRGSGSYEIYGTDCKTGVIGYKPFQKGYTQLDRVKPRDQWVWGDIYNVGSCLAYKFDRKTNRVVQVEESSYEKILSL